MGCDLSSKCQGPEIASQVTLVLKSITGTMWAWAFTLNGVHGLALNESPSQPLFSSAVEQYGVMSKGVTRNHGSIFITIVERTAKRGYYDFPASFCGSSHQLSRPMCNCTELTSHNLCHYIGYLSCVAMYNLTQDQLPGFLVFLARKQSLPDSVQSNVHAVSPGRTPTLQCNYSEVVQETAES